MLLISKDTLFNFITKYCFAIIFGGYRFHVFFFIGSKLFIFIGSKLFLYIYIREHAKMGQLVGLQEMVIWHFCFFSYVIFVIFFLFSHFVTGLLPVSCWSPQLLVFPLYAIFMQSLCYVQCSQWVNVDVKKQESGLKYSGGLRILLQPQLQNYTFSQLSGTYI